MSVNEQTSAVFNAFIEADKALKELPAVKAKLEETQNSLISATDSLEHANSKATMLQGTIEALQAELHAKEAALAAATFRESQLSKVVDSIRGALPVVATGNSDVSVVDKDKANEGQSEVGPTSHVASTEAQSQPASTSTVDKGDSAGGAMSQGQGNPTSEASSPHPEEATHNTLANPPAESSQSTKSFGGHPPAPADSPNMNSGPLGGEVDQGPDASASQREANPTSTHVAADSEQVGAASMKDATPSTSNLRYLGHYPHEKPSYLSWSEWDAMGGQTPNWWVRNRI